MFAGTAAAKPVVVAGTGDPNIDVPAVQAAVDQGGHVVLRGHFSFDRPPTKWFEHVNGRTILVSKQVVISGMLDENGEMTTIEGGNIPFAVDASGSHVTIQRLRFVHPKEYVILVRAVNGLVVAHCRIESVEPQADPTDPTGDKFANGIFVVTTPSLFPPTAEEPGQPENVSGTLSIFNNDIDVGGTARDVTLGISVYAVGSPDQEVDLYISGNNVRNITERPINLYQVAGRVHIERNVIATGAIAGPPAGTRPDGIHAVGSGSYLIAHNTIVCEWATGAGIRVQGSAGLEEAGAIIVDNDVTMLAPEGTVFSDISAGIEIRGRLAQGNVVLNNRIRGRARAALVLIGQGAGAGLPGNNKFVSNDLDGFQSSLADVFIDAGVTNATFVIGRQNIIVDRGEGTVIVRTP
jgi:hypothetical protein